MIAVLTFYKKVLTFLISKSFEIFTFEPRPKLGPLRYACAREILRPLIKTDEAENTIYRVLNHLPRLPRKFPKLAAFGLFGTPHEYILEKSDCPTHFFKKVSNFEIRSWTYSDMIAVLTFYNKKVLTFLNSKSFDIIQICCPYPLFLPSFQNCFKSFKIVKFEAGPTQT